MGASLQELSSELKWQLYYELDAPSAAALCLSSSDFREFCHERKIRIATLVNYYRSRTDVKEIFQNLLARGQEPRDVEHLEALLTLHPNWLSEIILLETTPLMAAALWQLGADPLLPVRIGSWQYDPILVKDKRVPAIVELSVGHPSTVAPFALGIRLARSVASIPSSWWELLPVSAMTEMLYLAHPLSEQTLVNMLFVSVTKSDYNSARELLERDINPLTANTLRSGKHSSLIAGVENSVSPEGQMVLWLMLHYTAPEPMSLVPYYPHATTIRPQSALGRYVNAVQHRDVTFDQALLLDYPILFYLHTYHTFALWNTFSFWYNKWKRDLDSPPPYLTDGKALRHAYRHEITLPLFTAVYDQSNNPQLLITRGDREYEKGLYTTFICLGYKVLSKQRLQLNYESKPLNPDKEVFFTGLMPFRNYTLRIGGKMVQFDSLNFLRGALKACEFLKLQPTKVLGMVTKVNFD